MVLHVGVVTKYAGHIGAFFESRGVEYVVCSERTLDDAFYIHTGTEIDESILERLENCKLIEKLIKFETPDDLESYISRHDCNKPYNEI